MLVGEEFGARVEEVRAWGGVSWRRFTFTFFDIPYDPIVLAFPPVYPERVVGLGKLPIAMCFVCAENFQVTVVIRAFPCGQSTFNPQTKLRPQDQAEGNKVHGEERRLLGYWIVGESWSTQFGSVIGRASGYRGQYNRDPDSSLFIRHQVLSGNVSLSIYRYGSFLSP